MRYAGIDLGSRTIKLVVVDQAGSIVVSKSADTTFHPLRQAESLLQDVEYDEIQATGYGRNLYVEASNTPVVSEIIAHAAGAVAIAPDAKAILDIGGQDTKVIAINQFQKVQKFEMNDRCAAGTGKFLEVMSRAFGIDIEEFGNFALTGEKPLKISNMCTVFAESEATSLMAKGAKPENIALGLHQSIVKRSVLMLRRVCRENPVVFTGGVALNPCMCKLIIDELGENVIFPENPQITGAFGAALLLRDEIQSAKADKT